MFPAAVELERAAYDQRFGETGLYLAVCLECLAMIHSRTSVLTLAHRNLVLSAICESLRLPFPSRPDTAAEAVLKRLLADLGSARGTT